MPINSVVGVDLCKVVAGEPPCLDCRGATHFFFQFAEFAVIQRPSTNIATYCY